MRKGIFFIFAYLMLGIQFGISRYAGYHGAAPNLGLIAALFIALFARRNSALLGSFAVGLLQDLLSYQQPGLYALSYGLLAVIVVIVHRSINPNHPASHFLLALLGGFITAMVLLTHSLFHPASPAFVEAGTKMRAMRIPPGIEMMRVVVTAVIAPFLLVPANRVREVFSFHHGRKHRGWW